MSLFQKISFPFWLFFLFVAISSCGINLPNTPPLSQADKVEIERIQRELPLVLKEKGWEAYQAHFLANYENWPMARSSVRNRETFLAAVKAWYAQGNFATKSTVETIGFVPLNTSQVLYLHRQKERFNGSDSAAVSLSMVSVFEKTDGRWKLRFTAFGDY